MKDSTIEILERNVRDCEKQLRRAWSKNSQLQDIVTAAKEVISLHNEKSNIDSSIEKLQKLINQLN